jgi:hypothetical protein
MMAKILLLVVIIIGLIGFVVVQLLYIYLYFYLKRTCPEIFDVKPIMPRKDWSMWDTGAQTSYMWIYRKIIAGDYGLDDEIIEKIRIVSMVSLVVALATPFILAAMVILFSAVGIL